MSAFYIAIDDNQKGPFSVNELREMGLNKYTLVWKEGMSTWKNAEEIEELEDILKSVPPPLPNKEERIYNVEAKIKKEKKDIITPITKITAAKEIKTNFNFIIYAIIIGIISLPVYYFGIYNVPKYDNIDYSKIRQERDQSSIRTYGVPFDLGRGQIFGSNLKADVKRIVKKRKEKLTQKSITSSFLTLIISIGVLIVVRYISKGVKWVNETSKVG